ncbi:hypothetical protein AB3S75_047790 [Citrus x aurantiifolia]
MAKRSYSILQKKLKELESVLSELLSLPPETPNYNHQLYAQDIEQRFEFVRKLLSAEITSSNPKKRYHLQHIARRLAELESIFKEWDNFKALTVVEHFEPPVSTCSCAESCVNDNDGDGDGDVSPKSYEGLMEEEVNNVGEKKEEKRVIIGGVLGKYVGVMGAGVVIGMALMGLVIVKFSSCFNYVEHRSCLLLAPT